MKYVTTCAHQYTELAHSTIFLRKDVKYCAPKSLPAEFFGMI